MRISIRSVEENKKISLILPLSLIKSKLIWHIIKKNAPQVFQYYDLVKTSYHTLKKYIKKHGHFVLMECYSHDGEYVFIKV